MAALTVYAADSLTAYRAFIERVRKHPLMTAWFIVLMLAATWIALKVTDFIALNDLSTGDFTVQPHTLLLVFFLILMGKSVVDTNSRATQNKEMLMIISQPVNVYEALWGKFAYITMSNLALLALASGTVTAMRAVFTPDLYVPFWFVGTLVPLALLASAMGFTFSIITSQPSLLRRLAGVAIFSQLASALYLSYDNLQSTPNYLIPATMFLYAVALCAVPVASRFFLDAWNAEVSGTEGVVQKMGRGASGRFFRALTKWMRPDSRELLRKELVINISRKEVGGTIFTIIGLAVVLLYLKSRVGGTLNTPFFSLIYPLLVCIGLYTAAVLQYAMLGLSSLGKEGKNFWILKHLPVKSERIFEAKAGALLVFTPIIVVAVAIPLPLVANMGADWVLFFIIAALALAFGYTAIGLVTGTMFPNFDEGTRGTPDVMTMYLVMMACLVLGALVIGIPGYIMGKDHVLGVLAMIFSADMMAAALVASIGKSARNYDKMEVGV
jgi:hypothetical protein